MSFCTTMNHEQGFFSGSYSSEEEESFCDGAYQAYNQIHKLWIVLFQDSICLSTSTSKSLFQIRAFEYFI